MGPRLKIRYFLIGILGLLAILVIFGVNQQNRVQNDLTDYESLNDEYSEQKIDPKDAWMYKFVEPSKGIKPKNIFAFECELRTKRPETLTTVCADFGKALWEIKWGKWNAFGGHGEGIYRENDCDPSCAEGTIRSRSAEVLLTDLTFDGVHYYFNTAKLKFKDKKYKEGEFEFVWDIASFYREVPGMRSDKIYGE